MKTIVAAAIFILTASFATQAQARHHFRHHHHHYNDRTPVYAGFTSYAEPQKRPPVRYSRSTHGRVASGRENVVGGRPAGCPHSYCGCEASRYVFGKVIADLNLARNWIRKFTRTQPAPGMVAARNHHVFVIMAVNGDGTVLAHDGNSGHGLTREHNRSLAGFRVVDPHRSRYASR